MPDVYEIRGQERTDSDVSRPEDATTRIRTFWKIDDVTDHDQARSELILKAPTSNQGFPVFGYSVREDSGGEFFGEVEYSSLRFTSNASRRNLEPTQFRLRLAAATTSTHITHGRQIYHEDNIIDKFEELARNYRGAINVSLSEKDKPKVEGTEVLTPQLTLSLDIGVQAGRLVDQSFVHLVADIVGKMNGNTFFGFEPGELLCTGASSEMDEPTALEDPQFASEATFDFAISRNQTNIPIGEDFFESQPQIVVPEKLGWDWLQVVTTPWNDKGVQATYPAVIQADIIRVYEFSYRFNDIWRL